MEELPNINGLGLVRETRKLLNICIHLLLLQIFVGYPQEVKHWGVDVHRLSVRGSHPIVGYENWNTSGGWIVRVNDDSADIVFGSPYTSGVSVRVTTIYGEKYSLKREYIDQITRLTRVE